MVQHMTGGPGALKPSGHSPAPGPLAERNAQPPAVEVTGLVKIFGPVRAVDGIDLHVAPGEVVAFLGPNGAGKSTTLDIILGFSSPDAGAARVFGLTPAQAARGLRTGAILQEGGLLPDYTVGQTIRAVAAMRGARHDISSVQELSGISPILGRRVAKCSGGERQRLRLALLGNPDLMVLDEPTAGMDVTARRSFWAAIRERAAGNKAVLFATHYLQEAADFADRIIIIHHGRIIASGSVDDVRALGEGTIVTATWPGMSGVAALDEALAEVRASLQDVAVRGEHVELRTTAPDDVARILLTRTPAHHLGITPLSLDDVFADLVEDSVPAGGASAPPAR
ncbi:ABC transporter ATP-binding protein [Actinomyces gaoshouyii]|uniref:ABC transporter ATP-binding protein n=1 Tax=Actinomyces gaoshouyii TaxID=1960083 RepID=UPI0009BDF466|nr:ABC transporter ATP-binding protein [Actinomyces gaoshouyii]ARD41946.1 multidrug ABC transporter ATP-binding protein [Actinomyces gaoshouyii]